MEQQVFEKELAMCQKLSKENGGRCNWGECAKCGVVPFLYKLGKGEFYEKAEEVEELKRKVLQ